MARVKRYLTLLLLFLPEGLSQLVRTQQVVIATLGEDAHFSCRLMKPKDVLQVTWQKVTPGATENVATYNKRFGPVVNPPFQRNVEFEDEGLQNCSIVIRGVSRGDESCYKCLFNAYPDGAISGRTCLQINELYGPSLLITQTNNSHTTLSCSATGRPVPTVTWDHIENISLDKSTMADVTHPNETVTVTITAMVAASSLPDKDTRVGCVASSVGAIKDVSMVIPTRDQASFAGTVVGAVMGSMCLIAGICVILWFLKRRKDTSSRKAPVSDPEFIRTPTKTTTECTLPCFIHFRETPTSSPPTRDTQTFTPSRMTTPISSPFKILDSLSSSAKRMMQQAQGVVKKISPERPDDLQCRRKLLEGDEN
ncbi:OX-2 membrane glycoprotein-like isoform X3 [Oncorhynchus mykiss]|uniref:OX-2 membrane glycoprotein-like isoform X3 n=1 Tax=Oncorhynchus mykiss TaxID=8022 RepID=UPI001877F1B9|nr:OX-2 membrane glycoprotein-like isoform X3 [Oncorhynchus mykiss]